MDERQLREGSARLARLIWPPRILRDAQRRVWTYTEHQCRHAERQLRRNELARARQRAPRLMVYAAGAGLAMGVVTTVTIGLLVGAAAALGFVVLAFVPGQEQRKPWQQWRGVRRQLVARLRELTADWTVLWGRRFDSAPRQ